MTSENALGVPGPAYRDGDVLVIPRIGRRDLRVDYATQEPLHWRLEGSTATIELAGPWLGLAHRVERFDPRGRVWFHILAEDHGVRIGDDNASLLTNGGVVHLPAPIVHMSSTPDGEFVLCQPPNQRTLLYRYTPDGDLLWQMGPRDFRPDDPLLWINWETASGLVVRALMNGWEGLVDLDTGRFERVLRTNLK